MFYIKIVIGLFLVMLLVTSILESSYRYEENKFETLLKKQRIKKRRFSHK